MNMDQKMTKLKTLKDLKQYMCENHIKKGLWHRAVTKEELKAEAVKWVKFRFKGEVFEDHVTGELGINNFMEFFNLTEEDLK